MARVKGDYLALVTLAFGVIFVDVSRNWVGFTGGPIGLPGIPHVRILGLVVSSPPAYCALVLVFVAMTYFLLRRVVRSPFGRTLEAVREDEVPAASLGIHVHVRKVQALVVSSFIAGIAGSLYAHYLAYIDPNRFSIMESFQIISIVIIGGAGSLTGALIGAAFFVLLPEILRLLPLTSAELAAVRQIIFALVILAVLILRPKGILGKTVLLKPGRERNSGPK